MKQTRRPTNHVTKAERVSQQAKRNTHKGKPAGRQHHRASGQSTDQRSTDQQATGQQANSPAGQRKPSLHRHHPARHKHNARPHDGTGYNGRIARAIAHSGLCSRREAERLISAGQVRVNGKPVLIQGSQVTRTDRIEVRGQPLPPPPRIRLWRYHKPRGLVTSHKDERQRASVFDAVRDRLGHVISIGRLDLNSEGLLLLTNAGPLARQLELPGNGFEREYRVRAFGHLTADKLAALQAGKLIDGRLHRPARLELEMPATARPAHSTAIRSGRKKTLKKQPASTSPIMPPATLPAAGHHGNFWFRVTLTQGMNREIRKLFAAFDLKVNRLIRTRFGPILLGDLKPGELQPVGTDMLKRLDKERPL